MFGSAFAILAICVGALLIALNVTRQVTKRGRATVRRTS
jgi:hypothetical protein